MIRIRTGLAFLCAVLALQASPVRLSPTPQPVLSSKQPFRTGCPVAGGLPLPISPGRVTECELKLGESHNYLISLKSGDLFQARVDQRGVDAIVTFLGPEGEVLLRMDSLNGAQGEEPVLAVASQPGQFTLRVSGGAVGSRSSYRLSVQEPRSASPADRVRADALRKMTEDNKPALALQNLREALQALRSIQDGRGQMLVLERLVMALDDRRLYSEVLARCREGVVLAQEMGDAVAEARFLNLAGLTHRNRKDLESAQEHFERILDLSEQERDPYIQALVLNNLGLIAEDRGRFQEALDRYTASLEIWEDINDPGQHANALVNLGEVYISLGEPSKALEQFNKALLLLKQASQPDLQYAVLNGAGLALHEMDQIPKALWSYGGALSFADRPEQRALTLHRLGSLYRDEGEWEKASTALLKAIHLARSVPDTRLEAYALADLADVHRRQGSLAEALRKFDLARSQFEEMNVPIYVASALFGRAEVERDQGRPEAALASVTQSIGILEDLRADVVEPGQRAFFFASRHRFYDLYVELLMQLRRPELAFEATESAKARTQLDDMAGRAGPATEGMSLEEIQHELLDRDSLLLAYSLGPHRSQLWVVSQEGIESFPLPGREKVEELALNAWRGLSKKGGKQEIDALSRMLLPPALHLSPGKRLIVIPDGSLYLVPFAALQAANGRWLLFDHTIVYEPSASVLVGMRRKLRKRLPAPKAIAVLGDPVFRLDDRRLSGGRRPAPRAEEGSRNQVTDGLKRLHFTGAEADVIRGLIPEKEERFEALGFAANRNVVLNPAFGRHRMLHFGTHHLSGSDPNRSGLVLSLFDRQGRPIKGLLRATEIYNLKLPVELVILSACGTGLAEEVRGEGPMGLPRAFFHAGAKRVVVSLWDIEDAATAQLMKFFYERMLNDKLPPAEALRSAQAAMAATPKWSHPRYWAPFVLLGEPD